MVTPHGCQAVPGHGLARAPGSGRSWPGAAIAREGPRRRRKAFSCDQVCLRNRLSSRGKDKYLAWVQSIAATLQAPVELRRLASYDNAYALTPHRVVEFTFDSPEDAARYFDRQEIGLILKTDLPEHSANIHTKVLVLRDDYSKDT